MIEKLDEYTIVISDESHPDFSLRSVAIKLIGEILNDSSLANKKISDYLSGKNIIFKNCTFDMLQFIEPLPEIPYFMSFELTNCKVKTFSTFRACIMSIRLNKKTEIENFMFHSYNTSALEINDSCVRKFTYFEDERSKGYQNANVTMTDLEIGKNFTDPKITKINNSSPITFIAKKVTFLTAPEITGQLTTQSNFIDCKFHDLSFDSIQKYRQLKAIFRGHNDDKLSDEFERLELIATHQNDNKSDWVNKASHVFYTSYNDYGRNFINPLLWMACFFLYSFIIFLLYGSIGYNENSENTHLWAKDIFSQINTSFSAKYKAAFTQSLINSLGYIGLFADNTGLQYTNAFWVVYGFIQKTIFTIMWFLFIMQVRRRFKLS
jgi:hypothetical protein